MKVSLSWLKDYVPIEMEVSVLADALTMVGLEVEAVSDRYEYLNSVLVGRIVEIAPHPNWDKLNLCGVDVGDRRVSVVCGAPNIEKGMMAPLAMPGTLFPDGSLLEKNDIRGITSEGMLCSEAELGLGADKNGIMAIRQGMAVGDGLAKALALSDVVFEMSLTPNRPDCLSIIGIAREVAVIQKNGVKYPAIAISESGDRISSLTSVSIEDPDHCPRYAARLLEEVSVAASPFWLQDRLLSVGLRPINNIVDVTNFVMMETGQPLHAFDFERLADNRIVVRTANEGEVFTTLDQKERALSTDMLMICDGKRPVAIGGIMGGLNSEIEDVTSKVLLESAYFTPVSIRKTSKALGLSTEASHRFERGVDPDGTIKALNRAARLMTEISGGKLIDGIIDEHPKPAHARSITLSAGETNRILGTRLDSQEIKNLLKSIEFTVVEKASPDGPADNRDKLVVTAPSFRVDISRSIDLMEEVARLSGYNHIPTTFPLIPAGARQHEEQLDLRDKIKGLMVGFGFTEAVNYSFINKLSCDWLKMEPDDPRRSQVEILNPLTEDQTVMRTSLVPGLLGTMRHNIAQQVRNLKVFEVGKIFIGSSPDSLPEEIEMVAGLWTGSRVDASWHFKETDCDFYDIKGVVEELLNGLNVTDTVFTRMPSNSCHYTRSGYTAQVAAGNEIIGLVGAIHPQILSNFDLKQTAYIFELDLDRLFTCLPDTLHSKSISKFPAISRDITIIVDKGIESANILESIKNMDEELLEDLHLFDVFGGDPIPSGKKSLSLRITYRSSRETLKDDAVNDVHKTIAERLLIEYHATLPA